MGHSYYHAVSSARQFGGTPEDYQEIHDFMDSSKATMCDARHRAVLHHSFGVFVVERVFGTTVTISTGKNIPVRLIAEQHIREDCGGVVPTVQDWLARLPMEAWMVDGAKKLSDADIAPKIGEQPASVAPRQRRKIVQRFEGCVAPSESGLVVQENP
jgi:hypothetical protein